LSRKGKYGSVEVEEIYERPFSEHKISIGRDKFFDLLRRNDLLIHYKRRR
jgi:hypothetical protein